VRETLPQYYGGAEDQEVGFKILFNASHEEIKVDIIPFSECTALSQCCCDSQCTTPHDSPDVPSKSTSCATNLKYKLVVAHMNLLHPCSP
jgi:hypothetical protein